jgi:hypothetical protein
VPLEIVGYIHNESSRDILSVVWQVESIIQALMLRAGNYGYVTKYGMHLCFWVRIRKNNDNMHG